jgi:glucose/arabinose dehydrogenase
MKEIKKSHKIMYSFLILIVIISAGGIIWYKFFSNINIPAKSDVEVVNTLPADIDKLFTMPEGFKVQVYATSVPNARVMLWDQKGRMLVSSPKEGKIFVLEDMDGNGVAESKKELATGLNEPHGMAFDCRLGKGNCNLYVAENNQLSKFVYQFASSTVGAKTKIVSFAASTTDRHKTRTLLMGVEGSPSTLLISIGSSCDVCAEKDSQHATIQAINVDDKKPALTTYATGLRNSVFMTRSYVDGRVFATEMGRDGLGDNFPPDEINIIEKGGNYGWPICYGKNINDRDYDKKTYIQNPCLEPKQKESLVNLDAHSAPLGLAFIPEEGWAEKYWYNLLVAYHGSWNRKVPTGYKIQRIKLDSKGKYISQESFITGWLRPDGTKIGRPADIIVQPGGTIFVSDDEAGVIYKFYNTVEVR